MGRSLKIRAILSVGVLMLGAFCSGLLMQRFVVSSVKTTIAAHKLDSPGVPKSTQPSPAANAAEADDSNSAPEKILSLDEIMAALEGLAVRPIEKRLEAVDGIVSRVASSDVPKVLEVAEKLKPEQLRNAFRNALLIRWAEARLGAALAYAEKVSGAENRQEAIVAVVGKWAEQDSASATLWVKQLSPGSLRDEALETLASTLAENDPESAFALVESSRAPREQFEGLASSIFV